MKTIMRKVSKKEIQKVLRTLDTTQIFAMYHRIYGNVTRKGVYDFIRKYAPSQRVCRNAYDIAYSNKNERKRARYEYKSLLRNGFFHGNQRKEVVDKLKEECQDPTSNYAKRPMLGHTHLYFCSPIYGHSDYNKCRMIPIEGNERFCELVIKYADKFFAPIYDNV